MNKVALVTGASRGIGLEIVRQYAISHEWEVIACCRNPDSANKLQDLRSKHQNVEIMQLDVCNHEQIIKLSIKLKNRPIDLLINNAGIYTQKEQQSLGSINVEDMLHTFLTNTVAPLKVSEALMANVLISKDKVIAIITSRLGSISCNDVGGNYAYRASKAAVNMVMKSLSVDCYDKGVRVLLLHPGWVRTDMAGDKATLDVETSVKGMLDVISANINTRGMFYNYDGTELPW